MFCNRKGEDDIMTRLKNGNKQESRAAPKWKRGLPMGIAFLLIIAFCGILFYNVALAAEKNYNPNGDCYIKVGDANLPVHSSTKYLAVCKYFSSPVTLYSLTRAISAIG